MGAGLGPFLPRSKSGGSETKIKERKKLKLVSLVFVVVLAIVAVLIALSVLRRHLS